VDPEVSQSVRAAGGQRIALDVTKRRGKARVEAAEFGFTLVCEDGSTIERTEHFPGAKVGRGGRFRIVSAIGGGFGPRGLISIRVAMSGRFTSADSASGTFRVGATFSETTVSPAVSCHSGAVAWRVG
jgi:hypothetical protein